MTDTPLRRSLRWAALALSCITGLLMALAALGLVVTATGGRRIPRGDSRVGDLIVAGLFLLIAGGCGFWAVRTGRRLGFGVFGGGRSTGGVLIDGAGAARGRHFAGGGGFSRGSRRRGARGKPMSEMTVAELRRAMWLTPVAFGTAVLAGIARIAIGVVEEELPVWLGVLLIVLIVSGPATLSVRARRRYRRRLDELVDPITGSLPDSGPASPLPLRVRIWLIVVPALAGIALVFAATGPGGENTCVSRGISTQAAREGSCERGGNLFGGGVTYDVVDAGHVLMMPGYQARLLASTAAPITVGGPNATAALYPDHEGMLVSFKISITNDAGRPQLLPSGQMIAAVVPVERGSAEDNQWLPATHLTAGPVPQLTMQSLAVGGSVVGWVSFILPISMEPLVHTRPSDLDFYRADGNRDHVGQIRLWKAANAAGAAALRYSVVPEASL